MSLSVVLGNNSIATFLVRLLQGLGNIRRYVSHQHFCSAPCMTNPAAKKRFRRFCPANEVHSTCAARRDTLARSEAVNFRGDQCASNGCATMLPVTTREFFDNFAAVARMGLPKPAHFRPTSENRLNGPTHFARARVLGQRLGRPRMIRGSGNPTRCGFACDCKTLR